MQLGPQRGTGLDIFPDGRLGLRPALAGRRWQKLGLKWHEAAAGALALLLHALEVPVPQKGKKNALVCVFYAII